MSGRPNIADVVCTTDEESTYYARLWLNPKGGEPMVFRISRGAAEVLIAEIRGCIVMTPDPTLIEQELDSGLRCNLDGAIGGTYQLPDGREFWMDAAAVRAILARIEPVILSWFEAHGQGSAALPSAAITDEMVEAAASTFFAVTADQVGQAGAAYSTLRESTKDKVRACARAALEAAMRATTPTAPEGQGR